MKEGIAPVAVPDPDLNATAEVLYKKGYHYRFGTNTADKTTPNLPLAFSYFKLALKKDPNYIPALLNLGICYAFGFGVKTESQTGVELLERVLILDNKNTKALLALGRCYEKGIHYKQNSNTGSKNIIGALQIDPHQESTWLALKRCYESEPCKAIPEFQEMIKFCEDNIRLTGQNKTPLPFPTQSSQSDFSPELLTNSNLPALPYPIIYPNQPPTEQNKSDQKSDKNQDATPEPFDLKKIIQDKIKLSKTTTWRDLEKRFQLGLEVPQHPEMAAFCAKQASRIIKGKLKCPFYLGPLPLDLIAAPSQGNATADALLKSAQEQFIQNNEYRAIKEALQAIELNPYFHEAYHCLGIYLSHKNDIIYARYAL